MIIETMAVVEKFYKCLHQDMTANWTRYLSQAMEMHAMTQ